MRFFQFLSSNTRWLEYLFANLEPRSVDTSFAALAIEFPSHVVLQAVLSLLRQKKPLYYLELWRSDNFYNLLVQSIKDMYYTDGWLYCERRSPSLCIAANAELILASELKLI